MRIDWVTFIAQLLNFAILVALLKRFLYGRILDAIDRRERSIADRIAEAERHRVDADREAESLRAEREALEEQRAALVSAAEREADEHRTSLMLRGRQEFASAQARWRRAIERQKTTFLAELRQRAGEQLYETVRAALRDLADSDLEAQVLNVFERRLADLAEDDERLFAEAAARSGVLVRSAFPIPAGRKTSLKAKIGKLAGDVEIRFETSDELLCGIELAAGERSIGWSLHSYLASLEESLAEMLERESSAPAAGRAEGPVADTAPGESEAPGAEHEAGAERPQPVERQ